MPKILVACPIKDRAWAIPFWHDAIVAQQISVDILCLLTPSTDQTEQLLKERNVFIVPDEQPGRPSWEIDGHCWGRESTYEYMAGLRNRLLDLAEGYDYFFSLDSDIILPDGALKTLLVYAETTGKNSALSPAVNMAQQQVDWNVMSWVNRDFPSIAERPLRHPRTGPADVIMAAMLLGADAISKSSWHAHPQGEDVGFCIEAEKQGIKRYWISNIRCQHLMRPVGIVG